METVASKISGSAGLSGMDSVQLKHHLLQHGGASKNYARWWRKLLAGWPILIIPGGQLIELSYTRLVALEKNTGIRPIGIGDILFCQLHPSNCRSLFKGCMRIRQIIRRFVRIYWRRYPRHVTTLGGIRRPLSPMTFCLQCSANHPSKRMTIDDQLPNFSFGSAG